MTRGSDEHGIANEHALMAGVQENQILRLVQKEEEQEQAAQAFLLHHQDNEEEDEPSEAASSGKPEKEIELLGSAFMGVVLEAIRVAGKNDHVDKKNTDAQDLKMRVG